MKFLLTTFNHNNNRKYISKSLRAQSIRDIMTEIQSHDDEENWENDEDEYDI